MRRTLVASILLLLTFPLVGSAQDKPDFSGQWMISADRSDPPAEAKMLIIKQTAVQITVSSLKYTRTYRPLITLFSYDYRINRWGPRHGGENSSEKNVQGRWDGKKFITASAPGGGYRPVIQIWSQSEDGKEMVIEEVEKPTTGDFDFKESSISTAWSRSKSTYIRTPAADSCGECDFTIEPQGIIWDPSGTAQGIVFRFERERELLALNCRPKNCFVTTWNTGTKESPARWKSEWTGGSASFSIFSYRDIELAP